MNRELQGHYITTSTVEEKVRAFVPTPLPPVPAIEWSPELTEKFNYALLSLGRLDSASILLPDTSLFLGMYVRKEAVISSMIEGTQSSLSDLLLFEAGHQPDVTLDDVQEVSNYVEALDHGLKRLDEGFPLSLRLLMEIHHALMSKGLGSKYSPGEFRKSQNWIGGSRPGNAVFVPPPPDYIQECMGKLELFLHDQPEKTSVLVKAALTHLQFETIHPFLDGNGRLGRLMITLLLYSEKVLRTPILYLSLYFKTHRQQYYKLLNEVRFTGNWEAWLDFFSDAIIYAATQAMETIQHLMELSTRDGQRINSLKRSSSSAHVIHRAILERPIASPSWIHDKTSLSPPTINKCLRELEQLGIVKEITGQKRNRLYSYTEYIQIMNKDTELPP